MIVTDDPGANDASNLTNYMSKEGHSLKNPAGNDMDETELNQFIEKSERYGFTRHFVLAPERDDLREEELDRAARKSMNEWSEGKDTLEYCYAVHNDDDNNHVHVAATASKDSGDLWFDTEQDENEYTRLRDDIAADHFNDHSLDVQQEQITEQEREQEQQPMISLGGGGSDDGPEQGDDLGPLAGLKIAKEVISTATEDQKQAKREQQRQQNRRRDR
jgi:hypothetical protein